jgi:hypothetical protein
VDAEKSGQGMKPSLAMDASVRAAYLVGDGVRKLIIITIYYPSGEVSHDNWSCYANKPAFK